MPMRQSALTHIIQRLELMQRSHHEELRRFEAHGLEKCLVEYHPQGQIFLVHDLDRQATYSFDNIDLVAIEIYELLG